MIQIQRLSHWAPNLQKPADTDLDVVTGIYHFAVDNIAYDDEKARNVKSGYLPDIDETLETRTGICFDYAALMTCMLRTREYPPSFRSAMQAISTMPGSAAISQKQGGSMTSFILTVKSGQ